MDPRVKRAFTIALIVCVTILVTLYLGIRIVGAGFRHEGRVIADEVTRSVRTTDLRAKATRAANEVKRQLDKTTLDEQVTAAAKEIGRDPGAIKVAGKELIDTARSVKNALKDPADMKP